MRNIYEVLIEEHTALVTTAKGTLTEKTIPTLAQYIKEEIDEVDRIAFLIQHEEKSKDGEKKKMEKAIQEIGVRIQNLQRQCKHRVVKHHSDPAGGNDSWSECQHCGASV